MVKMSLVRKITMLGTSQAQTAEPTNAELKAYFELRSERYRIPARFNLAQVYVSPDKHGERVGDVAADLLIRLRSEDPPAEVLIELGDKLMMQNVVTDSSEEDLARTFGAAFGDAVLRLPVGTWEGPVESAYGLHLVKITHRQEPRIPDWSDVRDRVTTDMQYEGRAGAEDQLYAEILPRYQVVISEGMEALLEGDDKRESPDK